MPDQKRDYFKASEEPAAFELTVWNEAIVFTVWLTSIDQPYEKNSPSY